VRIEQPAELAAVVARGLGDDEVWIKLWPAIDAEAVLVAKDRDHELGLVPFVGLASASRSVAASLERPAALGVQVRPLRPAICSDVQRCQRSERRLLLADLPADLRCCASCLPMRGAIFLNGPFNLVCVDDNAAVGLPG
jgi:hypothetical protein